MKPISADQFTQTGHIAKETIQFGFDQNSLAHLQTILSDLYTDPELAVLRELSTNALDTQIDCGYTGPVEVNLPTALGPILVIKDHGSGMDLDMLHSVYTKYGASTKRETNDQVGMLGIGSKSPLAIADMFTVETVRDGVKIIAVVRKNADGVGELDVCETTATLDDNGTTITIPTRANLAEKAKNLFRFWKPGTVLVNGEAPTLVDGIVINDTITLNPDETEDYIVMGNIPYPVHLPDRYRHGLLEKSGWQSWGVIVTVPIGSVQFAPSRETLNYSQRTLTFLAALATETKQAIQKYVDTTIGTIDAHAGVIEFVYRWKFSGLGITLPTLWRGLDIPRYFRVHQGLLWEKNYSGRWRSARTDSVAVGTMFAEDAPLIVTEWEDDTLSQTIKNRTKEWMNQNQEYKTVLFCEKFDNDDGWFDGIKNITIADLKAVKMPKAPKISATKRRTDQKWEILDPTWGSRVDVEELEDDVLYYSPSEEFGQRLSHLGKFYNRQVAVIGKNRWKNFLKEYPNATHVKDFIAEKAKAITWAEDDGIRMAGIPNILSKVNHSDINDPTLSHWIKVCETPYKASQEIQVLGYYTNIRPPKTESSRWIFETYPLISSYYSYDAPAEHIVIYINAIYNAKNVEN